jgi:hypothetical protein
MVTTPHHNCVRRLWTRFQVRYQTRLLRAELRRRGSSEAAYRRATSGGELTSAEAARHVDESLALSAIEGQLARLTTDALRRRMLRWNLAMPHESACWVRATVGGVLTAQGMADVERQLRREQRSRVVSWCLLFAALSLVSMSVVLSF